MTHDQAVDISMMVLFFSVAFTVLCGGVSIILRAVQRKPF